MPRRSWRDLTAGPTPGTSAPPRARDSSRDSALLRRAAPDGSPLAGLLAEREQLQSVLEGLTGPGETREDPRFPVTGLRERRAEIASWAAARDALGSRRRASVTGRRAGAGASRFSGAGTAARSQLLEPPRTGLGRYDQVRSALERGEEMLERHRQLAGSLRAHWEQATDEITGPMDRVGPYAEAREKVLDLDTGGSGDLIERAEAARRRALERRAELESIERRTARRAERRRAHRDAEKRDAERLERRTATGKGA